MIANNHFEGKAAANALELKAMLTGRRVTAPPELIEKYVGLKKFADPDLDNGGPEFRSSRSEDVIVSSPSRDYRELALVRTFAARGSFFWALYRRATFI